ncbi:MAG: glycosyltransferase, partial [Gemmatimonadales bacterium]
MPRPSSIGRSGWPAPYSTRRRPNTSREAAARRTPWPEVPETGDRLRFSLVVQAYNEEALLPRLLDSVDVARARYQRGAAAVEVIVADNASTDRTAELGRTRECVVVHVEKRRIAAARNAGAGASRGDVLAFIDADSQIHPDTFNSIDAALASVATIGGTTGTRFERSSLGLRCSYGMLLLLGTMLRLA